MTVLYAADSISETVLGLLARGKVIMLALVLLLVVFGVAQARIQSKSWIPAIGAGIIGAFCFWMVLNVADVKDRTEQEITDAPSDAGDLNTELGNNNSISGSGG